jgi:hypothetical protein
MNRRGIIKFIGFSLIVLVILAVVIRVTMTAKSINSLKSSKLEDQRIRALTYPEPSDKASEHLVFREYMGKTNINSIWIGFGPITDRAGNELGELLISVGTYYSGDVRNEVSKTVLMTFETTGNLRLPVDYWRHTPLILTSDHTIHVKTDQYTMDLVEKSKEEGHTDAMAYNVPTEFFVEAVMDEFFLIRIQNTEIVIVREHLETFRDLAAYLKPGVSP